MVAYKTKKKKVAKNVPTGRAYVQASYNNTLITFTDNSGDAIAASSAGQCGFKGPKKSTPYAAGVIVKNACEKAKAKGLKEVFVFVKGVGSGREAAIRAINANGINISGIKDITPIPHNGPRAKKPRRV
ncbi:MAG: 30S ribosomal protein S11 [Candidatus Buchananbacteria bacterium CG10_big_fil_rev_8_21_14_0_10_42_9]|uniref:Small ribosomal subunit protein uS11 n=1 Tax=Candidatus Buchananbacteria bacterium CG10_big_fil_rev_8_21_14_0_10_42_9 TaxID=1974526 RepID=A0A2H0W170_9BACT|nr:MAG: 30S ribosomal protein S11 [Candidatus Buchananbacteria bacterium CG10_big_fil_rev_8_21_14_0_10_42_9]